MDGRDRPVDVDVRRRDDRRRADRPRGDRRRARRLGDDPLFHLDRVAQPGRAVPQDHVPHRARHDHGRRDRRRIPHSRPCLAACPAGVRGEARRAGGLEAHEHQASRRVGRVLGHRHRRRRITGAAPAGRLPDVRGAARVRVRAGQRNISRHHRLESHFLRVRGHRCPDGRPRAARSDRWHDGGHRPAGLDQRGLRHAAGPLHGLAPRHQPDDPVPLPGGRHRDGRDHGRRASPTSSSARIRY